MYLTTAICFHTFLYMFSICGGFAAPRPTPNRQMPLRIAKDPRKSLRKTCREENACFLQVLSWYVIDVYLQASCRWVCVCELLICRTRTDKSRRRFWAIARHHEVGEVPGYVEKNRTSLTADIKPFWAPGNFKNYCF